MHKFCHAALWALILAVPRPVSGQDSELLRGVTEVQIIVENLDDDNRSCGLTEDGLKLAAAKGIMDGGVRVVDTLSAYVYVNVNTLHFKSRSLCVSSFSFDVKVYGRFTSSKGPAKQTNVSAFSQAGIQSSARNEHRTDIQNSIAEIAVQAGTALRLANQSPN